MFEISKNISIQMEIFENSKIYTIDNFYENPNSIVEYLLKIKPDFWKQDQKPSYNSIYFEDRRHDIEHQEIIKVYDFLSFICNQKPKNSNKIYTNATIFKKCDFNNYYNNYWWPHLDMGYNGIVYLNANDQISGTNLYENLNPEEEPPDHPEHFLPWRSKNNWKLVKTLIPRYNRLVLFDGAKFWHGMNICNDDYFNESYRFNQVFFFE